MAVDFEFVALCKAAMKTDVTVMAATDHLAERVADEVKSHTPVFGDRNPRRGSPAYGEPGDARKAIKVEAHPTEPLARRVISRDFKAIWIEVGTKHMPEYAPFTKAAKLFGGTGPIIAAVADAQHNLRGELEKLAKLSAFHAVGLKAGIAKSTAIQRQREAVHAARQARTQAFNASRQRGPRRRRR